MVDRDVTTRLLVVHGFLTRCHFHPDVIIDEGVGGRAEDVAQVLAHECGRFGSREELELAVRGAIATATDLCPRCS